IIKRLPLRYTFDNNYFNDKYQGIPIGGYNKLIEGLLEGIEVRLGIDFFTEKEAYKEMANKIVYTGKIDEYFGYSLGHLQYRSLAFEHAVLDIENYQGSAAVNYTDYETPYTRIVEHKHFEFGKQEKTVITKEYPLEWDSEKEPYYPINDNRNEELANHYKKLKEKETNVIFGGRLAEYKYYDMHQVIGAAIAISKKELG
ncbi:MAG: UDP-galactopyranose mutase, partial [Sphingobacteriales bacterium]